MSILERRPTIIDVARRAGVSKSTVSLVLRNSKLVKAETRARVRAAMAELGYVYNRAAATLRSADTGLVGLVINDLRNPFFTEFATSLQMALSAQGHATVIANTDEDPALQAQVVAAMIGHGVSAMILSPAYGDEAATFDALARAGIPAMQVLRRVAERTDLFPFAAPDYLEGSRIAARHLLQGGARRIAFVGGPEGRGITSERMAGYVAVLKEAGMEPLPLTGQATRAFGRAAARRLTVDYPDADAALCFNDQVALGMLSGFAEIGLGAGRDFRVVGFDDIEEAAHSWPALSSVHCDIAGFGRMIAGTVLTWLQEDRPPPRETRTPVSLRVRASSAGAG